MIIDNQFEIGQTVYLKTDADQRQRIVTAVLVKGNNAITYELACGSESTWHYDFEVNITKDVLLSTTD